MKAVYPPLTRHFRTKEPARFVKRAVMVAGEICSEVRKPCEPGIGLHVLLGGISVICSPICNTAGARVFLFAPKTGIVAHTSSLAVVLVQQVFLLMHPNHQTAFPLSQIVRHSRFQSRKALAIVLSEFSCPSVFVSSAKFRDFDAYALWRTVVTYANSHARS